MTAWQAHAEAHAAREAPAEACGLLVVVRGRLRYWPAVNVAPDTCAGFQIRLDDQLAAEDAGEVVAVVHSHPGAPAAPGPMDLVEHAASGLAWWILGADGWHHMPPAGARVYSGRVFAYGSDDCLELVREWCWRERGVHIPAREALAGGLDHAYGWWLRGGDLYRSLFEAAGFRAVDSPAAGDVLLLQMGAPVPNHLGVLMPGGRILHHLDGRLSCAEPYDRIYRERTTHVLRHHTAAPHDPPPG